MYKKEEGSVTVPHGSYPEPHELVTARYLASLGKQVVFIVPIRTKGAQTPDIFMDGVLWEIKSPTHSGRWAIDNIINKAVYKSGNIVFDVCRVNGRYGAVRKAAEEQFRRKSRIRRLFIVDSGGLHEPLVLRKK